MIQRIQSIYLALAFICMALLLIFPIFTIELSAPDNDFVAVAEFGKDGIVGPNGIVGNLPLSYVIISLALLTFASILMFKKRPRQLLLCRLNLILHVFLVLGIYGFYYFGESFVIEGLKANNAEEVSVVFYMSTGFFLLIATVAFIYLAIRGIKRDEKLINSLDRLR